MEKSEQKIQQDTKIKKTSIAVAGLRLLAIALSQSLVLWLISTWYPDVNCSSLAQDLCKPKPVTEKLLLQAFVPMVFIPLAIIQTKQIIMLAGGLKTLKRWLVVTVSSFAMLFMMWQFFAAIGALLGRWFT